MLSRDAAGILLNPAFSDAIPVNSLQLESEIHRIGREIFAKARAAQPGPLQLGWWQNLGMNWTMRREALKERLFRFIGDLPRQDGPAAIARSLRHYIGDNGLSQDLPFPLRMAVDFDDVHSLHARLVAWAATFATEQMARNFIVGSTPPEAIAAVRRMRRRDLTFTLDILGETVRTGAEAERFHRAYLDLLRQLCASTPDWEPNGLLDQAPFGSLPRANLSVKLSALSADFTHDHDRIDTAEVTARLLETFRMARREQAFVNVDMEHYALRDATLDIFRRVCDQPDLRDWPHAGIVVQAYLRDSRNDIDGIVRWARQRGTPTTVRLVKGAYWDYETERAAAHGRPSPVWSEKWESDASFEELSTIMLENADVIRPAYGSHNVRSIAHTLATADALGLPPRTVELQALYGMGDPLKAAIVAMGQRLRVYCPMGAWVPGVAYLVRRLLENTANESFLRQGFAEGADEATLLARPDRSPVRAIPVEMTH